MLRVGLLGARRGRHLLSVFGRRSDVQIVGVCDAEPVAAEEAVAAVGAGQACTRVDQLLEMEVDIVVVATPPALHAEHAIRAIEAGCHVLSEVPAVVSIEEAKALTQAATASSKLYMMAENCIFWPFVESWREESQRGEIGDIVYAEAEYIHDLGRLAGDARPTWRNSFPPIMYSTHSLGPLLSLSGDRCRTASGFGTGSRTRAGYQADDLELGVFKTVSGAVIKILIGFSVVRKPPMHYYSIYGTRGVLESTRDQQEVWQFSRNSEGAVRAPLEFVHQGLPEHATAGGHGSAEHVMIDAFLRAVRGEAPNPIDVFRALDYTLPGIVAHMSSAQEGTPLEVPDPRTFSR